MLIHQLWKSLVNTIQTFAEFVCPCVWVHMYVHIKTVNFTCALIFVKVPFYSKQFGLKS